MGCCHPSGDKHNEENESLCPSVITWVRGGMITFQLNYLKRVPDKDKIKGYQQINASTKYAGGLM